MSPSIEHDSNVTKLGCGNNYLYFMQKEELEKISNKQCTKKYKGISYNYSPTEDF